MESWLEIRERRIQSSESLDMLRAARDDIQHELHERLLASVSPTAQWMAEVNRMHDALIVRCARLAEAAAKREGLGDAPVPYAFVLFGSGGRREQTLWSDQDNGLVFADGGGERAELFFARLAALLAEHLEAVGYPPCEGQVVAVNAEWRKTAEQWERTIDDYFQQATWEQVRQLLVIADMRCVYGDGALAARLRRYFSERVAAQPHSIQAMLRNTLRHKVVLGPFGNLIREPYGEDAGGFDIKYGAYIPIVNAVRLLGVKHGIDEMSTLERIKLLRPVIGGAFADNVRDAFERVLLFRAQTPFQAEDGFYSTRGKLQAPMLTKEAVGELKACLRVGERLQKYIKKHIST